MNINMDKVVGTKTLFKSNADFSTLNKAQQEKYVMKLTDEFLESANDLMISLKDK